jgi:uncharacterized protein
MILPIIVRPCLTRAVLERPFAPGAVSCGRRTEPDRGESLCGSGTWAGVTARRLQRLPWRRVCGLDVPVATGLRARLLGLAHLDQGEAGPGLLIPRCAGVHTFGMRFELDLLFLDRYDHPLAVRIRVPPRRLAWHRGAAAVLEIPSSEGGEFAAPWT